MCSRFTTQTSFFVNRIDVQFWLLTVRNWLHSAVYARGVLSTCYATCLQRKPISLLTGYMFSIGCLLFAIGWLRPRYILNTLCDRFTTQASFFVNRIDVHIWLLTVRNRLQSAGHARGAYSTRYATGLQRLPVSILILLINNSPVINKNRSNRMFITLCIYATGFTRLN